MSNIRDKIIKEAKRIEEDSLYSAKKHFITASFWKNFHYSIGIPSVILASISGVSALSQFDNHGIIAGILALTVAVLTSIYSFLNPEEISKSNLDAGNRYLTLRNQSRIFHDITCSTKISDEDLTNQLIELTGKRDELNQNSPQNVPWAYKLAKREIEKGEATYVVDTVATQDGKQVKE